jgi:hypothetical protein
VAAIDVAIHDGKTSMRNNLTGNTWQEDPTQIIVLANRSRNNYILEMPSGRFRLDAGRSMRTIRSILNIPQVKELVSQGQLVLENPGK